MKMTQIDIRFRAPERGSGPSHVTVTIGRQASTHSFVNASAALEFIERYAGDMRAVLNPPRFTKNAADDRAIRTLVGPISRTEKDDDNQFQDITVWAALGFQSDVAFPIGSGVEHDGRRGVVMKTQTKYRSIESLYGGTDGVMNEPGIWVTYRTGLDFTGGQDGLA